MASKFKLLLSAALISSLSSLLAADSKTENWSQWRGPSNNGTLAGAKPPLTWSETENIKWKVKVPGSGTATPIIWDNKIFIPTAIKTGVKVPQTNTAATAPQAATPSPSPAAGQGQPGPREGGPGGPRRGGGGGRGESPSEVHKFVLMALDRATGKVLWEKVCREEVPHEGHHADHGYASSSPITDGKIVLAHFGGYAK